MQHALEEQRAPAAAAETTPLRFKPVMHLSTGETQSVLCQSARRYSDRVSFGIMFAEDDIDSPAKWLAEHIEEAAHAVNLTEKRARPVIIRAPFAAFAHPDTGIACEAAIKRTRLCPQEVCLDIQDGALSLSPSDAAERVRSFRRRGFRVSLDARKAWNTVLDTPMRLMLDAIHIDAEKLFSCEDLQRKCTIATAAGISVIAERAKWRDADALSTLGVQFAISPRTDA